MPFWRREALEADEAALIAKTSLILQGRGVSPPDIPGETHDTTVARFLRARNGKPHKAADMLEAHVHWRGKVDVDALRGSPAGDVLGCSPTLLQGILPHRAVGVGVVEGAVALQKNGPASHQMHGAHLFSHRRRSLAEHDR